MMTRHIVGGGDMQYEEGSIAGVTRIMVLCDINLGNFSVKCWVIMAAYIF